MQYKNVHDSEILSYYIDIEHRSIIFNTLCRNFEIERRAEIRFENVLAHYFRNVSNQNVISDIYEERTAKFLDEYSYILDVDKEYGWPINYKNKAELSDFITENEYKVFYIDSSVGLFGFVIAKTIL
jgi:ribosomal protein S18